MKYAMYKALFLAAVLMAPILLSTGTWMGFDLEVEVIQSLTEEEETDDKGSETFVAAFYLEDYILNDSMFFTVHVSALRETYSFTERINNITMEVRTPPPELS